AGKAAFLTSPGSWARRQARAGGAQNRYHQGPYETATQGEEMRSRTWLAALLTAGALFASCHRPAFLGGSDESAPKPPVCEGRYALCTSAPCTPIPVFDAKTGKVVVGKALCECVVANGPSLGNLPCAARTPQDEGGRYLVSTYSFGETAIHPTMTCPTGTPW